MLKNLRKNNAQVIVSEYVAVFFLILAIMSAMTIFFKRSIQARVHDARAYMFNTVLSRTQGFYNGNLRIAYEPYYAGSDANVLHSESDQTEILPSFPFTSGIFRKTVNDVTSMEVYSETAPPRNAM